LIRRQESHDDLPLISAAFAAQFLADFAQREIIAEMSTQLKQA
jgi:hypothetical protein